MNSFRGRPSTVLRSVLAMLLLCAQILAAAHALGHFSEIAPARQIALAGYSGGGSGVSDTPHLPAAERHERCLLCLAAADLAAALPCTPPFVFIAALSAPPPPGARPAVLFARPPVPLSRGPPSSAV